VDNVDKINLIKETLERRGITQTKLAELLGVNLTTVNNWFRRGNIPTKYINNISMLFNLNIDTHIEELSTNTQIDMPTLVDSNQTNYKDTVALTNINSDIKEQFFIDVSLLVGKELDNIRYNNVISTNRYIDIIDIYVDKYCGDGYYYLEYPHRYICKKIKYNFSNNTYTVLDIQSDSVISDICNLDEKLAGKVIVRIEIF
jgi:transcriptional regulator with XRE-family HTH domain